MRAAGKSLGFAAAALSFFAVVSLQAATFVVPTDRDLVHRADAIVVATAVESHPQYTVEGSIETVTTMLVTEVIKGRFDSTIDVYEPGGALGNTATLIAGSPRFEAGDEFLLFLASTGKDRWSVSDLVLGKFRFGTDVAGTRLLLRDEEEIVGWDPDLTPHREPRREANAFLRFVRAEARGERAAANYDVAPQPLATSPGTGDRHQRAGSLATATTLVAPYTANSYTMTISGALGARWTVFPNAVTFYSGTTQEPGAPGGGTTAISKAFSSWNNECGSNVNYVYGGTDSGSHTQGLHGSDGANTILFERDLSSWGVSPFTCSANGYSGTLGLGGVTVASGTNTLNGESFMTTKEADVEMNRGLANCTLLFDNGDFNSGVTHEVGHTLGFRHSDQNRASSGACSSDPSLECSSQAIMKSFVSAGLNGALQTWDVHAVEAVYPGNVCSPGGTTPPPPACTPPSITTQPASLTITSGMSVTLNVAASGTTPLSYQWYLGASGSTGNPIAGANGPSLTVSPSSTASYWVRVTNSCGSADSAAATVTVSAPACTPPSITTQPGSPTIQAGQTATLIAGASGSSPLSYQWYIGSTGSTSSPIAGANGPSITVAPTTTTSYWLRVSNSCGSADSATATVTVSSPPACDAPSITTQPASLTTTAGSSTTLFVGATGTAPLSYQWYFGNSGATATPIAGANGPALTVNPASTTSYWVRVSNACGSVNSSTATVTIVPPPPSCTPPSIISQPQSTTIVSGTVVTLFVEAGGSGPLSYQWFQGFSGDVSAPVPGATGTSLTVGPGLTTRYWVRVSSSCGTANSDTATVTVTTPPVHHKHRGVNP